MESTQKQSFASINLRSFITVICILLAILLLAGGLSYVLPQGSYEKDEDGNILPDTYTKGKVDGIALWLIPTAPFRVFAGPDGLTVIMISLFLLIMSGVFNVMEKTQGVNVFIRRVVLRFADRKRTVLCIVILCFMLFGSFFGMFEELVALLPIILICMLSLGFDTMTGLAVCLLASCFGFSAAITNPFSVGLASEIAGVHIFDGVLLRLFFFALIYGVVCFFLLSYTKKIERSPERSLTYLDDKEKQPSFCAEEAVPNEGRIFKVYAVFFGIQLLLLVLIASVRAISGLAIPLLSLSFLVAGMIAGRLTAGNWKATLSFFGRGAVAMLPAVFMVAIASSVKLVLEEGEITATVMHSAISFLDGKNPFLCVLLIYLLVLFLQIFIGSASAKLMLVMPIVLPIAKAVGISPATVIFTYCIADGFTDVFLPTNPILLVGLSMANVSYAKWIRFTWLLQLFLLVFTVLLLFFAVWIGY